MPSDVRFCPTNLHTVDDPDEADLERVPRAFTHRLCGGTTVLSPRTVRLYLRDPYRLMGAGSSVWCAACGKNARAADCTWDATGQNVREYYRLLIGEAVCQSPFGWCGRFLMIAVIAVVAISVVVALAVVKQGGNVATAQAAGAWTFAAAATLALAVFLWSAYLYRSCAMEYRRFRGE